jgi:Lon protease-like protein
MFITEAIWPTQSQAAHGPQCPLNAMVATIEMLVNNPWWPFTHVAAAETSSLRADGKELQALAHQLSASLSKRVAANTAQLESGTVPTDLSTLLIVIDALLASAGVIETEEGALTPAACMRVATLVLNVRGYYHAILLRAQRPC